jgi:putative ABC transport system permease protein
MLKHLFKLIWKKKRSNFLMMVRIFVSFLILFAAWSLGLFYYRNYVQPSGSSVTNVWALYCGFHSDTLREQNKELVKQKLKTYPQIESFAFAESNVPFSFSSSNNNFRYKDGKVQSEFMQVEPDFKDVLGLKILSGRFLESTDKTNKYRTCVINRIFKEKLFGDVDPIGKILNEAIGDDNIQIIGVVENFKFKSDYQAIGPCVMLLANEWADVCLIKVKPNADLNFEAKLNKELLQLGNNWSMEVQHMENMKYNQNKIALIPILILFIVYSFLVFNVALGLFGVLFQTINRRKGEIGVRRAMGATKNNILWQFVSEAMVIATFGLALGVFFCNTISITSGIRK